MSGAAGMVAAIVQNLTDLIAVAPGEKLAGYVKLIGAGVAVTTRAVLSGLTWPSESGIPLTFNDVPGTDWAVVTWAFGICPAAFDAVGTAVGYSTGRLESVEKGMPFVMTLLGAAALSTGITAAVEGDEPEAWKISDILEPLVDVLQWIRYLPPVNPVGNIAWIIKAAVNALALFVSASLRLRSLDARHHLLTGPAVEPQP
jgi:hypothetical protein